MKAMYVYGTSVAQKRDEMCYTEKGSRILRLDNRTGELTYREDGMYPMPSVHSKTALTYSEDGLYSNIGDRPLSSNMRLTRRNDYKISDDSDTEVIYASGSWHNIIPYKMK